MKIIIDIPDKEIDESLSESKHISEDEGEKGCVELNLLYTNNNLDSICITRKKDFYSCDYLTLPKGHGRLADMDEAIKCLEEANGEDAIWAIGLIDWACSKRVILDADKTESGEECTRN